MRLTQRQRPLDAFPDAPVRAQPVFLLASATVANPGELAERLTGLSTRVISRDGSPGTKRSIAMWNPPVTDPETDVESPLRRLTSRITGPATAKPGERVSYTVTLANPTDAPVPLAPCPGYLQELFSQGSGAAPGHSSSQLYQLNCRPVAAIPAHGEVSYEMVVVVPKELEAGRQLTVGWRIVTRQRLPSNALYASFAVRID